MADMIIVKIKDGQCVIEGSGFEGKDCEAIIDKMIAEIGEVKSKEYTSEYYKRPKGRQGQRQGH